MILIVIVIVIVILIEPFIIRELAFFDQDQDLVLYPPFLIPNSRASPSYSSLNHQPMKISEKRKLDYGDLICYKILSFLQGRRSAAKRVRKFELTEKFRGT